ncbi:MAG: cohesin domain-containing protein [Anaerolineae bacterium]
MRRPIVFRAWVVIGIVLAFAVRTDATRAQTEEQQWDLHVANVHNLYGVGITLTFDPSVVEVIDADPERPGVQITPGPLFSTQPHFVAYNRVTVNQINDAGIIEFVATLLNPAEAVYGSGIIATVHYQPIGSSSQSEFPFTIEDAQLATRQGRPMMVEWQGNTIRQVFRFHLPLIAENSSRHATTLRPYDSRVPDTDPEVRRQWPVLTLRRPEPCRRVVGGSKDRRPQAQ